LAAGSAGQYLGKRNVFLRTHDVTRAGVRRHGGRGIARPKRATGRFVLRELLLWASVYPLYLAIRGWSITDRPQALADASRVIAWERSLNLFHETELQDLLRPFDNLFSAYYMLGFGPVIAAVLVLLAAYSRPLYRELRLLLFISLGLALIAYVAFPTAPPRLVPGLGIADTVGLAGHDTGSFAEIRFNPYAAMPSLHVGWSLLAAIVGFRATRRRWLRGLAIAHPALMALAVTQTGNHYVADSLAGALVALLAVAALQLRPWVHLGSAPQRTSAPARCHGG
jgi:membrane-associated phospholipid phosphatase